MIEIRRVTPDYRKALVTPLVRNRFGLASAISQKRPGRRLWAWWEISGITAWKRQPTPSLFSQPIAAIISQSSAVSRFSRQLRKPAPHGLCRYRHCPGAGRALRADVVFSQTAHGGNRRPRSRWLFVSANPGPHSLARLAADARRLTHWSGLRICPDASCPKLAVRRERGRSRDLRGRPAVRFGSGVLRLPRSSVESHADRSGGSASPRMTTYFPGGQFPNSCRTTTNWPK